MVQVVFRTIEGAEIRIEAQVGETVMAAAMRHRAPGVEAACGGSMVCGTCHIYVSEPWFSSLSPPSGMEAEMHEYGAHVESNSRLACQITITPALEGAVFTTPPAQR